MLVKATEELLIHLGYDAKKLMKMIDSSAIVGDYPRLRRERSVERFTDG
jgi:hypothetical protein